MFVKKKEDSMPQHPLHLFSGTANRPLAERIAECLQMPLGACETKHLPDSEVYVEIHEAIRGQDIFFIQPCSAPVNDNLMELLLYVDAFRRASAHTITVVVPYFPYSRQERMAHGREAISARVVARMLQTLGVTRVVYVDIHAEATQGFFDIPVDPLSARKVFIEYFENKDLENPIIVAPDVGRAKLAGRYAEVMGLPLALMHKRRLSHSEVENSHVVGDLKDKTPIVIDDMIAGGSILTQLNALVEAGARPEIYLAITHPILLPTALAAVGLLLLCFAGVMLLLRALKPDRFSWRYLVFTSFAILLLCSGYIYYRYVHKVDLGTAAVVITVKQGDSFSSIVDRLYDQKV